MSNEVSIFNDDYKTKFRTLYLEGKNIKECNEILGFNQGTFDGYYYLNKHGLREYVLDVKKEFMLRQAEDFSRNLMSKKVEDDKKLLAIQQKEAEFLRETQGKEFGYTKRNEQTGADGQPLTINLTQFTKPKTIDLDNQDIKVVEYTDVSKTDESKAA